VERSEAQRGKPVLGVGIGLRRELHDALLGTDRRVDWLEIVSENFMENAGRARYVLDACRERWPIVPHGVAASVGHASNDEARYAAALGELVARVDAPFFSDHLCYSSIGGHQSFDLLPLPFTEEAVDAVARRAQDLARRVGREMVLENITYYAVMPGSEMPEHTFVRRALEASGCGLLLDLNNLYVNAINHGEDPRVSLSRVPFERVRQIHLAGYSVEEGVLLDTHSAPVSAAVWSLYRETLARTGKVPTLIEWDQRIPSLDAVLDEADKARAILEAAP
jgi:uncharacterized protein